MRKNDSQLLREYVRIVLAEDDGYGGLMGAAAEMSPFGMHYASQDQLYNTFIKPFVDVVDVAKGKTKEMSERTRTALKVAYETVATSIIPAMNSDYGELFDHERQQLEKIKQEYAEVYDASWDALKQNDAVWASFLAYPAAFLTAKAVLKAPGKVMNLLSILSGGEMDDFFSKVKKKYRMEDGHSTPSGKERHSSGGGDKIGNYFESVLREDNDKKKQSIGDVLSDRRVLKKALGSPLAQRMQSDAQKIVKGTLKQAFEKASKVASAKSLEDLQKIVGKQIKGMDTIAKADPAQRKAAEAQLLIMVKKSAKEMYAKELEAQIKAAVKAGVPQDSGFVKDYLTTISRIKAL
jgi:hypothetical protein